MKAPIAGDDARNVRHRGLGVAVGRPNHRAVRTNAIRALLTRVAVESLAFQMEFPCPGWLGSLKR